MTEHFSVQFLLFLASRKKEFNSWGIKIIVTFNALQSKSDVF